MIYVNIAIETITQHLIRRAKEPASLTILTAVASSSFFFFGNIGLALSGVFPATITASERARNGVSEASALKLWEWAYCRARKHFASAALLGATSHLVASLFRPDLRPVLYGAALFSFLPIPYTLVVLMPVNKEILKIASASKHDGNNPDPGLVDKLFSEWRKRSLVRISIAGIGWSMGMAAILLA